MGPCRNRPYVPHFCARLVCPRSAHSRARLVWPGCRTNRSAVLLSARCCRSGFRVLQVRRFVDSSLAQSCQGSSAPPTMSATAAPKAPGSIAVISPSMLPSSGLPNTPRYGRASLGYSASLADRHRNRPGRCIVVFGVLCSTSSGNPQPVCCSMVALAAFAALLVRF